MDHLKNKPQFLKGTSGAQPEVLGFGLLASSAIEEGKLTVTPLISNRSSSPLVIEFLNSHYFIVDIEDSEGTIIHFNDYLPPPLPHQAPLQVEAGQDFLINFPVDTSQPPYVGKLVFDPTKSPYIVRFKVNSATFGGEAALTLEVKA